MSSFVTIYLHHHGDLTSPPNVSYIGGKVETLHNVDTDVFSFRDLDDFAVKYDYDPSALVYFKSDGSSFRNGVSLLYDDDTVREMVELHKPYGKISLFVDHFELDNLVDMPTTPTELNNKQPESNLENEANGSSEDDPEYDAETESESDSDESDNGSLYLDSDEDEELKSMRVKKKDFKKNLNNPVKLPIINSDESDFNSDSLRSESSSSEDENCRIGYVGPPNPKKRKKRPKTTHNISEEGFHWEVGQKFVNIQEAFFSTHSQADNVDNNMSECFNAWIINERYQPVLTMLQELHFKLMTRLRVKRDDMRNSDVHVCPVIKRKLDKLVTESRGWTAAWDGDKKYQVKQGTRAVTVDLDRRCCDCRVYDLTGIPCAHAIASIHDRRHNPIDYVSDYYKREKYLASYNFSIQAMKGEEFWTMQSCEEVLPPDIPKKLRGRPKKMRRREAWEGGSRSQASENVGGIQRFSNRRVMHCSVCGSEGHRKNKCPSKSQPPVVEPTLREETNQIFEEPLMEPPLREEPVMGPPVRDEAIRNEAPVIEETQQSSTSVSRKPSIIVGESQKRGKELRRQKLMFRRPRPAEQAPEKHVDKLAFRVPRKKLPLVLDNSEDGKDMCLRGNQSRGLEDAVRGPLGNVAVFEPIPPHTPFMPVGSRTSTSAVTTSQAPATSSKTSKSSAPSEAPPRRSARMLMKGKFNFKNSEDEPVFLGED
ncbi:uncharacterized protein LOC141707468 [Apium graveolens]|uniref:uncharacterized protein LOC141707468 n=2 Tax=Apium graveolens TaxID=4045 RepID=UPI003D78CCB9